MKRRLGSVNLWCQRHEGGGRVEIEEERALLPLVALALGAQFSLHLVLTCRAGWLCSAPAVGRWLRHSLFFTAALIVVTLIFRALIAYAPLTPFERAMRTAFLSTIALGLLVGFYRRLHPLLNVSSVSFMLYVAGAFAGGFLLTERAVGLVEVNHPPSDDVRTRMRQTHAAVLDGVTPGCAAKRAFDVLLSVVGLILSSPLWALIGLAIWVEDPGPIIFAKVCVAKGGGVFQQLKFRSMVKLAERETGPTLAQADDPRITLVGTLIRKTGMDELPQFLNIVQGTMSFVGPRPQRAVLVHEYLEEMPEYAGRHAVRPGLTGVAQVYGDYYVTAREKLRYDMVYVRRFPDFWLDLKLILLSLLVSLTGGWQNRGERESIRTMRIWFGGPGSRSGQGAGERRSRGTPARLDGGAAAGRAPSAAPLCREARAEGRPALGGNTSTSGPMASTSTSAWRRTV